MTLGKKGFSVYLIEGEEGGDTSEKKRLARNVSFYFLPCQVYRVKKHTKVMGIISLTKIHDFL